MSYSSIPARTPAFRFLDLPAELREMVYREVIPEEMLLHRILPVERTRDNTPHLFLLLAICTQIRAEPLHRLRTLKPIFGTCSTSMAALLTLFGEQASHIRRVKICGIDLCAADSSCPKVGFWYRKFVRGLQACGAIMTARSDLEDLRLHVRFGPGFGLWIPRVGMPPVRDIGSHSLVCELRRLGSFRGVRVTWSSWSNWKLSTDSDAKCGEWASFLEELLQRDLVG